MSSETKNLIIADTLDELPVNVNAVAIVKESINGYYTNSIGSGWEWVQSFNPQCAYPLDSVYSSVSEKDPNDILGFGKWDMIAKEPCFMWKRTE